MRHRRNKIKQSGEQQEPSIVVLYSQARRTLRRHVKLRKEEQEEEVQEVVVRTVLWCNEKAIELSEKNAALLLSAVREIARRRALELKRLRRLRPEPLPEDIRDSGPGPAELASMRDQAECIREAIERLPTRWAEVFRLRVICGLPFASIASRLAISETHARLLCHRATDRLRRLLGP